MKSLKQSRLDRIARKKLRQAKAITRVIRETPAERDQRTKKFFKKIIESGIREQNKKCTHGGAWSGYDCCICNADNLATRLRDEWYPAPVYKMFVFMRNEGNPYGDGAIQLDIKTRNPTKKIMEMQANGFWYTWRAKPVFMMPGMIKIVQLDDRWVPVQNPWNTDPPVKPAPKESRQHLSAEK
jgi:hypothetical protein